MKKYLPWIIGFVALGLMFGMYHSVQASAQAAADALAKKAITDKAFKDKAESEAYYKRLNDKLSAKIQMDNQKIDELTAYGNKYHGEAVSAQKKIAEMTKCEDARIALNFELTNCIGKVDNLIGGFNLRIDELTKDYDDKITNKDNQIGELNVKMYGITDANGQLIQPGCTQNYADAAAKNITLKASARRNITIAVIVGFVIGFAVHAL